MPSREDLPDAQSELDTASGLQDELVALREEARFAHQLRWIASQLSDSLTPVEAATVTLQGAMEATGASRGTVVVPARESGEAVMLASINYPEEAVRSFRRSPLSSRFPIHETLRDGVALFLEDINEHVGRFPMVTQSARLTRTLALASVPMIVNGEVLGSFGLSYPATRYFSQTERDFLHSAGQECARALSRAYLAAESRGATERLRSLQELTASFSRASTQQEIVKAVLETGLPRLGATGGLIALSEADGALRIVDASGYPDDLITRWQRIPRRVDVPVTRAARTRGTIVLRTLEERRREFPHTDEVSGSTGLGPVMASPVIVGERVLGALAFSWGEQTTLTRTDEDFLVALADACAQALDRARLYEDERQARERLEGRVLERTRELERSTADALALEAFSRALIRTTSVEEVGMAAHRALSETLDVSFIVLFEVRDERLLPSHFFGELSSDLRASMERGLERNDGHIWRVVSERRALYVEHTAVQRFAALGVRSGGFVPLSVGPEDRLVVLAAVRRGEARAWTERERRLLEAGAISVELALERAEQAGILEAQRHQLEERNAELETFVYTVSHDLRQPVLSIAGMAGLLQEAVESGSVEDTALYIQRVAANAARMSRLLDGLLFYSRAGRSIETPVAQDLLDALGQAIQELDGSRKPDATDLQLPPAGTIVRFPPTELYQVLVNLIGNASKFAAAEGKHAKVTVSATREVDRVLVRVCDNGPGIPAEQRERVFGLFHRLNPGVSGTGAGLAIVKRIIERHGGSIWVDDSPSGGACLAFTLPGA